MGTLISRGLAAFVLSASACVSISAVSAFAQTGSDKVASGSALVSVDILRHPVSGKVRQLLLKALAKMESGNHETAIGELEETLRKYPDSAPYVDNLLGVEYVRMDRFDAAVASLGQAAQLLPHDAMTHYNFSLALICAGDYDRATEEVRRALELDPKNAQIRARLSALAEQRRSGHSGNAPTVSDSDQQR